MKDKNPDPKGTGQSMRAARWQCDDADHCHQGQAEATWWIAWPGDFRRLWESEIITSLETSSTFQQRILTDVSAASSYSDYSKWLIVEGTDSLRDVLSSVACHFLVTGE